MENTFNSLKGKDLNQAVEEFTGEMTLVAEGLSEDQERLRRDLDTTAAQVTIVEENLRRNQSATQEALSELKCSLEKTQKQLDALDKSIKAAAKDKKAGVTAALRQATWLTAILAGAWVIVTLLKLIGG